MKRVYSITHFQIKLKFSYYYIYKASNKTKICMKCTLFRYSKYLRKVNITNNIKSNRGERTKRQKFKKFINSLKPLNSIHLNRR